MTSDALRVAYVGNFGPPHSTENHVRQALLNNGHDVTEFQENADAVFLQLADGVGAFDVVLWTRTGWDPPVPADDQHAMLDAAGELGVPTVGFHLDRWWGLDREGQVRDQPFFRSSLVVTADGGHEREFADAGVNHYWMPPAVSADECRLDPRPLRRRETVVFVGSASHYHPEWSYRLELVAWLRNRYRGRLLVVERGLRGQRLRDLYASGKVFVGDSCLAPKTDGSPMTHYWSDRIPETLGRGGFLIHPEVEGLSAAYTPGGHLETYTFGDFDELAAKIDRGVDDPGRSAEIAAHGRAHTLDHHTYDVRIRQLVAVLDEREMLR